MTAITLPAAGEDRLPTRTVVRRSVAAEWTRLWTVRSTWWSLLAGAGMMLFVAVAFGLDNGGAPVWVAGEIGIMFVQFTLLIPAMLAVTAEYSTRSIRTSLQAVPRRGVLALSRAAVAVAVATVAGVLIVLAGDLAASIAMGSVAEVAWGDVASSLRSVAVVVAAGAFVTVGLGALLRSAAGTLTSVFLLLLVLPAMLPNLGVEWLATIGRHLPGSAVMSLLDAFGDEVGLGTARAFVVLAAWATAAGAAGVWSLLRRDAA